MYLKYFDAYDVNHDTGNYCMGRLCWVVKRVAGQDLSRPGTVSAEFIDFKLLYFLFDVHSTFGYIYKCPYRLFACKSVCIYISDN